MAGTLFVVATPIGHLDDITLRALRVLREVAGVAAEDTRRTGNLLRHYGIATRLISLHAHNEGLRSMALLEQLRQGQSIALVSDAGTPGISDPGSELVRRAREQNIRVEAIPGPSAVAAAVSIAGLTDGAFTFLGFPPTRSKDRKDWFARFERVQREAAVVFFEAPHRIRRTLEDLALLGEQPIFVFRELTKLHEESISGSISHVLTVLSSPRGEFTVVVPRCNAIINQQLTVDIDSVVACFGQLTASCRRSRRAAVREVGKKFGLSTKQAYELTKDHRP